MQLNINTDAAVKHTNTLEKMHRSALPNAVRGTLNKAAFDVKQKTMPAEVDRTFTNRQPNFFKANSRVEMARGWNITQMKATVGFVEKSLKGGNNFAVKDLEQQEHGGTIKGRAFIPTDEARGGSNTKLVRPSNRLSRIKNVVNSNSVQGKSRPQSFIKAAIKAGKGGHVIGNFPSKKLYRIQRISKVGGRTVVKPRALYSYESRRNVKVRGTGFMRTASLTSANKMDVFYEQEAKRAIEKLKKR